MSDTPQGPDWLQAPNGKWYPPSTAAKKSNRLGCGCLTLVAGALVPVILVVIVVVLAAGGGSSSDTAVAEKSCAGKTYPGHQKSDICAAIPGTVSVGGKAVAATPWTSATSGLEPALCTNVTITNDSNMSQHYNVLDFKVQTPTGAVASGSTANIDRRTLDSGTLTPGDSTTGSICAPVAGVGTYVLIYRPNPLEATRVTWLLKFPS